MHSFKTKMLLACVKMAVIISHLHIEEVIAIVDVDILPILGFAFPLRWPVVAGLDQFSQLDTRKSS